MNAIAVARQPVSFRVLAVLFLLWNLLGVAMFYMQLAMTPEQLAQLPAAQREIHQALPAWIWGVNGLAVAAGTLGALMLLLRRKAALPLFWLSLLAVVVLFGYCLFPGRMLEVLGAAQSLPMPVLVTVIAIVQVWFARRARARGWIG